MATCKKCGMPKAGKCYSCAGASDRDRQNRSNNATTRRRNSGSTMYGRNYGSSKRPSGASGSINPRTGEGHGTQYYDDNTRLSWDMDGSGESNRHWTDQNKSKKSSGRHQPPGHAK